MSDCLYKFYYYLITTSQRFEANKIGRSIILLPVVYGPKLYKHVGFELQGERFIALSNLEHLFTHFRYLSKVDVSLDLMRATRRCSYFKLRP